MAYKSKSSDVCARREISLTRRLFLAAMATAVYPPFHLILKAIYLWLSKQGYENNFKSHSQCLLLIVTLSRYISRLWMKRLKNSSIDIKHCLKQKDSAWQYISSNVFMMRNSTNVSKNPVATLLSNFVQSFSLIF